MMMMMTIFFFVVVVLLLSELQLVDFSLSLYEDIHSTISAMPPWSCPPRFQWRSCRLYIDLMNMDFIGLATAFVSKISEIYQPLCDCPVCKAFLFFFLVKTVLTWIALVWRPAEYEFPFFFSRSAASRTVQAIKQPFSARIVGSLYKRLTSSTRNSIISVTCMFDRQEICENSNWTCSSFVVLLSEKASSESFSHMLTCFSNLIFFPRARILGWSEDERRL